MSTVIVDPGWPNLANVIASLGPDGKPLQKTIEIMSNRRAILEDMPWAPTMFEDYDLVSLRTGLPNPTWRGYNEGIDPSDDKEATFTETCGMLEDRAVVDVKLAQKTGNPGLFRLKKVRGKLEAFAQKLESAIFYSSAITSPKQLHGLTPRYPATSGYTASGYVSKGTNSGTNCQSVWLINWGPDRVQGIYPKGSTAGFQHEDKGKLYVTAPNAKQMEAFVDQFYWDAGLKVADYRYSHRHQWDPDDAAYADSGKGLYLAMQAQIGSVYDMDATNARFYMNVTSFNKLNAQLISNDANFLTYVSLGKRRVPSFLGIPIRITDSLVQEQAIS